VRSAALLVAVLAIVVGVVGLVSPDSVMTVRRLYFATPLALYAVGVVCLAMGLAVIMCAPASRAPKTLRALGTVVCMQGLARCSLGLIARERSSNGRRCWEPGCCASELRWR
jgi:hypothetical protein